MAPIAMLASHHHTYSVSSMHTKVKNLHSKPLHIIMNAAGKGSPGLMNILPSQQTSQAVLDIITVSKQLTSNPANNIH